jgi:hypothetical protein
MEILKYRITKEDKRVLRQIVEKDSCAGITCSECPLQYLNCRGSNKAARAQDVLDLSDVEFESYSTNIWLSSNSPEPHIESNPLQRYLFGVNNWNDKAHSDCQHQFKVTVEKV